MPRETVDSVTKVFRNAIHDLLKIETENDAEMHNIDIRISDMEATKDALMSECDRAAAVRVKLEELLKCWQEQRTTRL